MFYSFSARGKIIVLMKLKKYSVVFVVFLLLVVAAVYFCYVSFSHLNNGVLARREALASLASANLKERLDRVVDVSAALAARPLLIDHIKTGDWNKAIEYIADAPEQFDYIDNVVLFDLDGNLMQGAPPIPDVIGRNFAYRDYYQGVKVNWEPYISEVFQRSAEPKYNVVAVSVPIKDDEEVIAILVVTIKLETIVGWSKDIDIGPNGFIYAVDSHNKLVVHPDLTTTGDIVDYSAIPAVHKMRQNKKGVEILFNHIDNQERVSAYDTVPYWNWGVVVVEPTASAFAERNRQIGLFILTWFFIILIVTFMVYRVMRDHYLMKHQHDREHLLLASIGDGVLAIDRSWNITLWNKAAELLTGFSAGDVVGRPFRDVLKFINVATRKENITFIEEAMLYGETRKMSNHTIIITKDGRELPVGDSCAPIFDGNGLVSGAIVVFRDMSTEQELAEKEKELVRVKDDFLFKTVHDLRAPSNIIRSALADYFEADEVSKVGGKLAQGVEFVKEANNRMAHLIEELLSIGRGENPDRIIKKEKIDIAALIGDLLQMSKPVMEAKKIILNHVVVDALPAVMTDVDNLKEVFGNLLDNAIKYNKDGGQLTISYETQGRFLLVYIQDTGVGIASDGLNKIFAPYFRAYTGQDIQGTGLGLYIVKKLIDRMGGKISVNSTLGQGTKFTVYLPLA